MKKIIALILMALMLVGLVGCYSPETKDELASDKGPAGRFERIYVQTGDSNVRIYADTFTGVMYMYVQTGNGGGGLTVLVDRDGNPLKWEGSTK